MTALANFDKFNTITGILEDTASEISFAQLKTQATSTTTIVGKTTIQAFQITAPQAGSVLEYNNGTDWTVIDFAVTPEVWISKLGVSTGATPGAEALVSVTNLNLRWTAALNTNSIDNDGDKSTDQASPADITAFLAQAGTAVGVVAVNSSAVAVNADVIAINDAPTLTAVSAFANAHTGLGFAFNLDDLKAKGNDADVDNTDAQLTFKVDTIDLAVGDLKYGSILDGSNNAVTSATTGAVSYNGIWYIAGADAVEADTEITPSDVLIWTPVTNLKDADVNNAFTVTAWDGQLESVAPVSQVSFNIVNDVPLLTLDDTLLDASGAKPAQTLAILDADAVAGNLSALIGTNLNTNDTPIFDANDDAVTVTLSVLVGALSGTFTNTTGDTDGTDGTLELTGAVADVNAAIASLAYTQADSIDDQLTITVHDSVAVSTIDTKVISLQVGTDDGAPPVYNFAANATIASLIPGRTYDSMTDPLFIGDTATPSNSVTANNVALTIVGGDIVLTAPNANTLTLTGYVGDLTGTKIQFMDSSTLQYAATNGALKSTLYGTTNSDHLILGTANGGTLKGYAGNDKLEGSATRDVLYGGDGADTLIGNAGNDYLNGGLGNDVFVFGATDGADVIAGFGQTGGTDADLISFTTTNQNIAIAQSGADTLITIDATHSIRLMNTDNTTIDANDFTGNAPVISRVIIGTAGADALAGSAAGNDTIIGGAGADTIVLGGHTGNKVVQYNANSDSTVGSVDVVSGLVLNAGTADVIDLSTIAGTLAVVASQVTGLTAAALTGVGGGTVLNGLLNSSSHTLTTGFSGTATNVAVLTTSEPQTFLAVDLDGDGAFTVASDMLINITGADISGITAASFV